MLQIIIVSMAGATLGVSFYQGHFKKNHSLSVNLALIAAALGFISAAI